MKELLVSRGGRRVQHIALDGDAVVIGRSTGCHVRLEGQLVSRLHARLEPQDGAFLLIDTSSNGTLFNGERLGEPRVLASGDRFRVSDYDFVYLESSDGDLTTIGSYDDVLPGVHLDLAARTAWIEPGRHEVKLAKQEFDLLAVLHSSHGQVVTQQTIGDAIWGTLDVNGRKVAQYDSQLVQRLVARLRAKLLRAGAPEDTLTNVRGVGYKLQ